jgi:DNA-binding GntR family transcriptional regulator
LAEVLVDAMVAAASPTAGRGPDMTVTNWDSLDGADRLRTRRTTQQLVHEVLREGILSGDMPAGSRLIQDEIAARFNVSRVPVREALLQLEAEGLIRMEAHRGARIIAPSLDEIRENLAIRKLLMIPSVREAVPLLTDEHLRDLEAIVRRRDNDHDGTRRGDHHAEFYAAMLRPVERPRLVELVVRLEREIERFCQSTKPLAGHSDILDACRARDGEHAASLVERHMEWFTQRALASLSELTATAADKGVTRSGGAA